MRNLKGLFRGADAEPRRHQPVLQLFDVLEDEYERIHGTAPPPRSLDFTAEQIRDLPEMLRLLQERKSAAMRWIAERMSSTQETLQRFPEPEDEGEASRQGREKQLLLSLVADLNGLLNWDLAAVENVREGAERTLTRGLVADYPERAEAVDPRRLSRLLLEDIFPRALCRFEDLRTADVYREIHEKKHAALCLSGGGIRSATFALGVVQGLARHKLLDKFQYLSTVSGGGYLGGWLSAWMTHTSPEEVIAELEREGHARDATLEPRSVLKPEPAPIRHLRSYSNYLSPRLGGFSADTWTLVATVFRNLLLNWLVLVPLLAALVLVPHLAASVVAWVPAVRDGSLGFLLVLGFAAFGFVFGAAAVAYIYSEAPEDLDTSGGTRHEEPSGGWVASLRRGLGSMASLGHPRTFSQAEFLRYCLTPLLVAAVLLTTAWWWVTSPGWGPGREAPDMFGFLVAFGTALHLSAWAVAKLRNRVVAWLRGRVVAHQRAEIDRETAPWRRRIGEAAVVTLTGAIGGALGFGAASLIQWGATMLERPVHSYVVLALPLFLLVLMLGGQLYVGLASRWTPADESREWAARFNAWLLIAATGWLVLSALVLEGPRVFGAALGYLAGAGVLSGTAAVLLGRSAKTPGGPDDAVAPGDGRSFLHRLLLPAMALFAMATLIVLLSVLGAALVGLGVRAVQWAGWPQPSAWAVVALTALLLLGIGLVMSLLMNTNKFSLHAMYRMRLIRAYLGASRPAGTRKPDPFTGFDEHDNLRMEQLWPGSTGERRGRPLHVVNVALNLVGGQKLAWQERKASSFTVTPLHAGAASVGYRRTSPKAAGGHRLPLYGGKGGITLGTALTISGAAANPNMGYFSSPIVTFLMTFFNARLGWWLGNPGPAGQATYHRSSPRVGVKPILAEMFGLTTDQSDYVQLSDGGHFENLGLYEMVRRRCKFIVVSDASCDPDCTLQDLGTAIRRIRVDMGIPIDFDDGFRIFGRKSGERGGHYWALGRIRYSAVDHAIYGEDRPSDLDGRLVYIKPAFYGSEPRDIYNYALANPDFPHQSTVDQFFNESQFESYRALGAHVIDSVLQELELSMPAGFEAPAPERGSLEWFEFRIRQREAQESTAGGG